MKYDIETDMALNRFRNAPMPVKPKSMREVLISQLEFLLNCAVTESMYGTAKHIKEAIEEAKKE